MTNETKERIGELGRVILGILLVSAAAVTLATFPGLIQVLPRPKRRRKLQPWEIRRATLRLQEKRLVQALRRKDGIYLSLTSRGREYIEQLENQRRQMEALEKMTLPGYKPWDGWWRIVTFDIPQRKKYLREVFRTKLRALGFYPLEKSVFVHPSACEKEIISLMDVFEAHPYVHVIRAQHIDPEEKVRQYFEV